MRSFTTAVLEVALLLWLTLAHGHAVHQCFNDRGTFSIDLSDVYPESADFDPETCSVYISSTGNNTLVVHHLPSSSSRVVQFPGISYNDNYLLDGIDFDRYSGDVYISAGARPAFFTNGADLTGPSVLIRYDPRRDHVIWTSNITEVVAELEVKLGHPVGGFQDQAEDKHGNSYYMATWGNVLIKVDSNGRASPFYTPSTPTNAAPTAGFGGLFIQGDTLVVSDIISQSFAVFDLRSKRPRPHFTHPTNVPAGYTPLTCDSLYAPTRYRGRIALCADDIVNGTGGIVAYASNDNWRTAEYVGIRCNTLNGVRNSTVTATFETERAIYALVAYLPGADGTFVNTTYFPVVDVTKDVDDLVGPVLKRWGHNW